MGTFSLVLGLTQVGPWGYRAFCLLGLAKSEVKTFRENISLGCLWRILTRWLFPQEQAMVLRMHVPCHQCYVKSPNSRFHCDSIHPTGVQPLPPPRARAGLVVRPSPGSVPSADFTPQLWPAAWGGRGTGPIGRWALARWPRPRQAESSGSQNVFERLNVVPN